jgi:spore coat polysaccharide biosynthesis predicted glycosyltransferase SpsG
MSRLMTWADVAITGAGGTVYELSCLGVPTIVVAITEDQTETARALERSGVAVDLGWHQEMDAMKASRTIAALCEDRERRAALSHRARELVDGRGASRVVDVLSAF